MFYHQIEMPVDSTLIHANGWFSMRELPAGEYRLAALIDVEENEWRSSAFLESLLSASVALTVKDGATTRQDVRIR